MLAGTPVGQLLLGLPGNGQISFPSQKRRTRLLFHRIAFHRVEDVDAIGQRGVKGIQRFAESTGAFAGKVQQSAFHGRGGGRTGTEDVGA